MAYYKCNDCEQGFVAASPEEIKAVHSHPITEEQADGAKFCPYCGSLDIKKEKGKEQHGRKR